MNEVEYYLSTGKDPSCPQIPGRYSDYLDKNKHLSEFVSEIDKDKARQNLGIDQIINFLNQKIDAKVIKYGGTNWDRVPTQGHCQSVLSSDALYKTLCRYIPRCEVDALMQKFWVRIKTDLNEILNPLVEKINRYSNEVETFIHEDGNNGIILKDTFGNDTSVGINQKTITEAIDKIWKKLSEITGESNEGFYMSVTPSYFIKKPDINIRAQIKHPRHRFERIDFYINYIDDQHHICGAVRTNTFEYTLSGEDYNIGEESQIRIICKARIDNREYEREEIIKCYNGFWIYAGQPEVEQPEVENPETQTEPEDNEVTYEDIMNNMNYSPNTTTLEGSYPVTCYGSPIIIILEEELRNKFWKATIEGQEIEFNSQEENISYNGSNYIVLTSVNTYKAGNFNINITTI